MGESSASAAIQQMMFEGTCYLTPLLGAVLADSRWGRYKTILVFSAIYFVVGRCLGPCNRAQQALIDFMPGLIHRASYTKEYRNMPRSSMPPACSVSGSSSVLPGNMQKHACLFMTPPAHDFTTRAH